MSTEHFLSSLCEPQSIAVIGTSEKAGSIGHIILRNLLDNNYKGRIVAVNPGHSTVLGRPCVASVDLIDSPVDLVIITTPPRAIPEIMTQCGQVGIRNAILVTNPKSVASNGATLEAKIRDAAINAGVRFLGPKSLGIVAPYSSINATFAEITAIPGELALVTQSGAMCAAVLDWATMNRIGLSFAVSLGEAVNVDFGDILDYLASDERTRYILLHVEKIRHARRFISALRSIARIKPVILLKSGNHAGDENLGHEESEMSDRIFDAAVQRAGVVRVKDLSQLFHAARALASGFHPRGSRLAIISNGTGPARMAADSARRVDISIPELQQHTISALQPLLAKDWQGKNPIDLGGDATSERYLEVTRIVAQDESIDAVLVVLSPLAPVSPLAVAQGLVEISRTTRVTLCCCFMGGDHVSDARKVLEDVGIPIFRTPDSVIELFSIISTYYKNQSLLLQVPSPVPNLGQKRQRNGGILLDALIAQRRKYLTRLEAHTLLHAYGIPVRQRLTAHNATEAMFLAEQIGLPVDVELETTEYDDKAEDKALRIKLSTIESVRSAVNDLLVSCRLEGDEKRQIAFSVAKYTDRSTNPQLIIRVFRDSVFGPVIMMGAGNSHDEPQRDYAVALPPLNQYLARNLIGSTRIGQTLERKSYTSSSEPTSIEEILLCVSEMVCELPSLGFMEINLMDTDNGCVATEARLSIEPSFRAGQGKYAHMAIHPYPAHLCQDWPMSDGSIVNVRPVRPEDAQLEQKFVASMSEESRYFRFMDSSTKELPSSQLIRLTQVDYDRELGLIALIRDNGEERQIGSVNYVQTPEGDSVEFVLAVDEKYQRAGLGRRLMEAIIDCAREKLYRAIVGDVLADNQKMLNLMTNLGFAILPHPEGSQLKKVVKILRE